MIIEYPEELPVCQHRDEIIALIKSSQVVVIAGETGSGKTTQIPKMCLDAGYGKTGKIGCTQPRRVAALSVAQRIADELKVPYGGFVGSKIRFNEKTSEDTAIKIMTDGILLQELQNDRELREYEVLIIDEAHERSLNIDFILGLLRKLLKKRPELRVIITSATIDTQKFSKAFENAPIIEVSGKLYPVDVWYRPIDPKQQDSGHFTYIDGASHAVEELITQKDSGDVLVFMPSEADIREAVDLISGRLGNHYEVIPLFGRMSSQDQQRIFHPGGKQRVIIATNIAETSITVPRISSVVDSGLARISRFDHQTNTLRLPIEGISQSSADQRKGRCGRLMDGICVRLYDEEDYNQRERFTSPEIFRSSLASVILKLLEFGNIDIKTFPFIDPPESNAIRGAYRLLHTLGAVSETNKLTQIGRQLARLPVDLTIGKMLLQAKHEKALPEVSIIAAGLSIMDPRERPEEQRERADECHKRFISKYSDFVTLLNIWNKFHSEIEKQSQSQMRKYCKKHFLSYMRMREWKDIHKQIGHALNLKKGEIDKPSEKLSYDSVHRSILSGLLTNIAEKKAGNIYLAAQNREIVIFPGSGLFDKKAENKLRKQSRSNKIERDPSLGDTPEWIISATVSETSRVFARTVAKIDPEWILTVGEHLLRHSYVEPAWNEKSGRVLVKQKTRINGLLVSVKKIDYGKINLVEANEIFIRCALVQADIRDIIPALEKNQKLAKDIEEELYRLRSSSSWYLDERIYEFYSKHITGMSSVAQLKKWLHDEENKERFKMTRADLLNADSAHADEAKFPRSMKLGDQSFPIKYLFKPNDPKDGGSLTIGINEVDLLNQGIIDWTIPGLMPERIEKMIRALPKTHRQKLFPLKDCLETITGLIEPSSESLMISLANFIKQKWGLICDVKKWSQHEIPEHLMLRIEVIDNHKKVVVHGRNWDKLQDEIKHLRKTSSKPTESTSKIWDAALEKHSVKDVYSNFNYDLPLEVKIGTASGIPLIAHPGFHKNENLTIDITLYQEKEIAQKLSNICFRLLGEQALSTDIAWLHKDIKELKRCELLYLPLGSLDTLKADAIECILRHAFRNKNVLPLNSKIHVAYFEEIRQSWRGFILPFADLIVTILEKRHHLLTLKNNHPLITRDIKMMLPNRFLRQTPYHNLKEIPKYIKAMELRIQRWRTNPIKDDKKQESVTPFEKPLFNVLKTKNLSPQLQFKIVNYYWLLQEFKISIFAPEIKTLQKVSTKIMNAQLDDLLGTAKG